MRVRLPAELVDLLDPRPADERRRPAGQDRGDVADELLPVVARADEELDGELLDAARQHADCLDLRVVDVDHLSGHGAQARVPEGNVLDDPLELEAGVHGDRVAHREPALHEHGQPGDDVGEDPLGRKARDDDQEGGAGDGREAVDAADELADGEDDRGAEGHVDDARPDDRDERLAPFQVDHLAGRLEVGVAVPPLVPIEHA